MLKTAFRLDVLGVSDVGLVRKQNEDAWRMDLENSIFIVADGMGGHNAGEVASHLATDVAFDVLQKTALLEQASLKRAMEDANDAVYKKGREDSSCHGMGTTLVILAIREDIAFFAHIGDSRLYLIRDNSVQQLTQDHTLVNDLISVGTLNKNDDASQLPFKHILTKAIGTHSKVIPTFGQIHLKDGDQFLLATDGLSNYVSEQELSNIINKKNNLQKKSEALINLAKNRGGGDNITLILGKVSTHDISR